MNDSSDPMVQISPTEIVATLRESLVVLTDDLEVEYVSDRFLETFQAESDETIGRPLTSIAGGQWNIPALIDPLSRMLETKETIEGLEVDQVFESIGRRVMRLNARKTKRPGNGSRRILLAIEDVTAESDAARESERLRRMAEGIVNTVREPLLVLDDELRVIDFNRAYVQTFATKGETTIGRKIWELDDGQWSNPELVYLLTTVVPNEAAVENYEVQIETPGLGPRTVLLNARKTYREGDDVRTLLLAIEDVTERREIEAQRANSLTQAERLLTEMNHRVMNSLSMIGSVIAMEQRVLSDEKAAAALDRTRKRVESVAALYRRLSQTGSVEAVRADHYLEGIVNESAGTLSDGAVEIELDLQVDPAVLPTRLAVPLGLIVNELVTNSMKYAFVGRDAGRLGIGLHLKDGGFELSVWDDGTGIDKSARVDSGLGQKLTEAFVRQIDGVASVVSDGAGTRHTITFPESETAPKAA